MRQLSSFVVIFFLFQFVPPAVAGGNASDNLIEQASVRYADLDFEASLRLLEKAFKEPGNTRFQLVRIYHLQGLCHASVGQMEAARETFVRLLSLDSSFRLGAEVSPKIRAPFDALMKTNAPRLDIQIIPPPFVEKGKPVVFTARVASDPARLAKTARIWFKRANEDKFSSVKNPLGGPSEYPITIPQPIWETKTGKGAFLWYGTIENEYEGHLVDFGEENRAISLNVMDAAPKGGLAAAETPWYGKWWVWAIVGGVVAAGTTTAVVLANNKQSGPFDFTVDFR
jgi:hypothetical protein